MLHPLSLALGVEERQQKLLGLRLRECPPLLLLGYLTLASALAFEFLFPTTLNGVLPVAEFVVREECFLSVR